MVQERDFTIRAEKEYIARMCAKLGFARRTKAMVVDARATDGSRAAEEDAEQQQQQQQQQQQDDRCELDHALVRACRALLRRGSICMHDFFSALRDGVCVEWATVPEQILRGCSFEECARSLATKEWEVSSRTLGLHAALGVG
jgi:hypothetical protein